MKVAIVGATHGNEKTGAWLIEKWKSDSHSLPPQHDYFLTVGNPKALSQNTRYVDFDLNRSFNGGNPHSASYEYGRAQELKQQLSQWANGEDFFLIDLHTTTSNMGTTLIMSEKQSFNALILKQVQSHLPNSQVLFSFYSGNNIYLNSLSPYGILIEVGPTPQNLLLAESIEKMERATIQTLLSLPDQIPPSMAKVEIEGYYEEDEVSFPDWDTDGRKSLIHPSFQGKDFQPIKEGDSIFLTPSGQTIAYEGEPTHAIFINEAAYYEKSFAFTKCYPTRLII
jgi:aspartoacylase